MIIEREEAETLARTRHAGQTDRAGKLYIHHLETVAASLPNEELQTIAWLHDILEDTDMSADELRSSGFAEPIVRAVEDLTREDEEDYMAYIERLSGNPLAVQVKLADLRHNMDLSRLPEVTEKDLERLEKYRQAEAFLLQAQAERQNRHESD